jgi:hypothetical protein
MRVLGRIQVSKAPCPAGPFLLGRLRYRNGPIGPAEQGPNILKAGLVDRCWSRPLPLCVKQPRTYVSDPKRL